MHSQVRDRLIVNGVVLALVFCITARPVLNAADPSRDASAKPRTLAEELFHYAGAISRNLHDQSSEERNQTDYRRAIDAYGQVVRLNTDNFYSAEALARRAELFREMADESNDPALYQQAIEAYRQVITDHPRSAFVGDALISIAQINEENLQDLDGAAAAYRELVQYFPASVMAREARAVLARFDAQLGNRPADVLEMPDASANSRSGALPQLSNVRNFGGPDYARVVLDMTAAATYTEHREGNRLSIKLTDSAVAQSLYGRRFIVKEPSLLKRITVSEVNAAEIRIDIQVGSFGDHSVLRLSDPERLIIDLHSASMSPGDRTRAIGSSTGARPTATPSPGSRSAALGLAAARSTADRQPLYSLPEIADPILPANPDEAKHPNAAAPAAVDATAKIEGKAAEAPIKRIVIDPGHGGHDTGTISPSGMREKDLVLDVARRLRAYIKKQFPDVEVILTRDADRFIALEERTAIANSRHADLFISIHANASPSRAASGVETFFVSPDRAKPIQSPPAPEPAEQKADEKAEPIYASVTVGNRVGESRELARYIQSGLVRGIGAASPKTAANRGVKHAAFAVLLGSSMPSVLAEVSFLSNSRDEALLQKTEFRERIAASMFAGLNAYLKRNRATTH